VLRAVQAEFLSVPATRGANWSGAPDGNFGNQDTSFFGSEAEKTSWDNGLPSFGRFVLCFSPFERTVQSSSSLLVTHNC